MFPASAQTLPKGAPLDGRRKRPQVHLWTEFQRRSLLKGLSAWDGLSVVASRGGFGGKKQKIGLQKQAWRTAQPLHAGAIERPPV